MAEETERMRVPAPAVEPRPAVVTLPTRIVAAVAEGHAASRTELAALLDAAPSTVSQAVGELLARGVLAETGVSTPTGGRPRRVLRLGGEHDWALAADLGGGHLRAAAVRPGGSAESAVTVPFDLAAGPDAALERLGQVLAELTRSIGSPPRAIGLALPGPVDAVAQTVALPSRMPGWHGRPVAAELAERTGLTVVVENDANCMALGEHAARDTGERHAVTVKAGTAIGTGVVVDGRLHRGATGAAGDITHVRIEAAGDEPCSCGNRGCLETVASGAALTRILRAEGAELDGRPVEGTADVIALAHRGDPLATGAVRRAGGLLGEVLAATVNFLNPDAVHLGGSLSALEPWVAAVRSRLYDSCHPLVTERLVIDRVRLGADAAIVGAGVLALRAATAQLLTAQALTDVHDPARRRGGTRVR